MSERHGTYEKAGDEGRGALLSRLIADAREFVSAEIALYKALGSSWAGDAKVIAIYAVAALLLVNGAIIALFVGLVLTLQPLVGPGLATLIVVVVTLCIAGLLGWMALGRVRKMTSVKPS